MTTLHCQSFCTTAISCIHKKSFAQRLSYAIIFNGNVAVMVPQPLIENENFLGSFYSTQHRFSVVAFQQINTVSSCGLFKFRFGDITDACPNQGQT